MLLSCDLALKSYLFESSKSTGQWQCKASLNETIMKYNQYVLSGLVVLVTILSIIFAIFLKHLIVVHFSKSAYCLRWQIYCLTLVFCPIFHFV